MISFGDIRNLLLRNWRLKLIALALALLLRLIVVGERPVERLIPNVRLEFRNLPENMEIAGPVVNHFDVLLLAPPGKAIQASDLAVVINLQGVEPGTHVFNVELSSVKAPDIAEVLRVSPTRLALRLDKTARKSVKIIPTLEGSVAPGYRISDVHVLPETTMVSGPAGQIESLRNIPTNPISVNGLKNSFRTSVTIADMAGNLRVEQIEPVHVTLEIKEISTSGEFQSLPQDKKEIP